MSELQSDDGADRDGSRRGPAQGVRDAARRLARWWRAWGAGETAKKGAVLGHGKGPTLPPLAPKRSFTAAEVAALRKDWAEQWKGTGAQPH